MNAMVILGVYLIAMNVIGFAAMGSDKRRAVKDKIRISEKTLFILSVLGGSLGTFAGMYVFRHKTKHWYFVIGMPAILIIHIVLLLLMFIKL